MGPIEYITGNLDNGKRTKVLGMVVSKDITGCITKVKNKHGNRTIVRLSVPNGNNTRR